MKTFLLLLLTLFEIFVLTHGVMALVGTGFWVSAFFVIAGLVATGWLRNKINQLH